MNDIFRFLASDNGRLARGMGGIALITVGLGILRGVWGIVMAVIGLVPLLAGVFDFCAFAPLFGLPFEGEELREELGVLKRERIDFMEGVEYQLQD